MVYGACQVTGEEGTVHQRWGAQGGQAVFRAGLQRKGPGQGHMSGRWGQGQMRCRAVQPLLVYLEAF